MLRHGLSFTIPSSVSWPVLFPICYSSRSIQMYKPRSTAYVGYSLELQDQDIGDGMVTEYYGRDEARCPEVHAASNSCPNARSV